MLDKVVIINKNEALLIFTAKHPIRLHSDECIYKFLDWYFNPAVLTLREYTHRKQASLEDTCEISLKAA